jgi:signal transduction histidine kinase
MTLRTRMSLAFVIAALLPLGVLAHGTRREVTRRLTAQHDRRVNALVNVVRDDLARESASIAARLEVLAADLSTDDRFRLGAVRGDPMHRRYVLDWAERAMEVAGLSMLRVYDDANRIVTSGHFRNEFDRIDTLVPSGVASVSSGQALTRVKTPTGSFFALVRADSVSVGGRRFLLIGGTTVDDSFFARLGRDGELSVSLQFGDAATTPSGSVERLPLVLVTDSLPGPISTYLEVAPLGSELSELRSDLDRWILGAVLLAALAGAVLVAWLAARLSRPMATLAHAALAIEFRTPDVESIATHDDEVGTLARRFAAMTRRLRASAARLREAERRATVGEMARQVNHDMKNGLIPIRNVVRHLARVEESAPHELATVFAERRHTLEASVAYLDELATRWARLTPRQERRAIDVNAIVMETADAHEAHSSQLRLQLQQNLSPVLGDPVAIRRILDNLVANATQSLRSGDGSVTISTQHANDIVRIVVSDSGCGMTQEELARALAGFYTTKPHGSGLGLSVVRRLVADHGGRVEVDSTPGKGTTVMVELPTQTVPNVSDHEYVAHRR